MKILLLILFIFAGCATRTPVTDKLTRKVEGSGRHKIEDVPVIAQKENHCGPASLAMVLQYYGKDKTPDELAKNLFHKKMEGSFRSDVLASARQEGMMAFEMDDLRKVFKEVENNHPVIVFQNLRLESAPQWHFSVLRGMDLKGPDVYVNSGTEKMEKMDMRLFERSWILGGQWGALILPPDKISATATDVEHVEAASLLEASGNQEAALIAYKTILERWHSQHLALIGAANVTYARNEKREAEKFLLRAVKASPKNAIAFHNLALVQAELGKMTSARKYAEKALTLATTEQVNHFQKSLGHLSKR